MWSWRTERMKTRDSPPPPIHVHVPETTPVHVHMRRSPSKTLQVFKLSSALICFFLSITDCICHVLYTVCMITTGIHILFIYRTLWFFQFNIPENDNDVTSLMSYVLPPEQDKQCPGYGNWWEAKVTEAMDSSRKLAQPKRCGLIQVSGLLICNACNQNCNIFKQRNTAEKRKSHSRRDLLL